MVHRRFASLGGAFGFLLSRLRAPVDCERLQDPLVELSDQGAELEFKLDGNLVHVILELIHGLLLLLQCLVEHLVIFVVQ